LHLAAQYNFSAISIPTTVNSRGGPVDENDGAGEMVCSERHRGLEQWEPVSPTNR
jgi:hypothetical protein